MVSPPTRVPRSGASAASTRVAGTSARDSSSSPTPGTGARRTAKVTKSESLETKVARMYRMLGTMVKPAGRFYPVLTPIGDNLKLMADEAAEAWIELAEQDKRVKEALESLTSASTWGNVIGIHFAIFASAIPVSVDEDGEIDLESLWEQMTPADQAAAQKLAAEMMGSSDIPVRDKSTGGPGDTVKVSPPPTFDPKGVSNSAAPSPVQATASPGIVSAAQLGVTQVGNESNIFPSDPSPPNGR